MDGNGLVLRVFLDELVKDTSLRPIYDADGKVVKTFCNFGIQRRAPGEKFDEFASGVLADDMYRAMTQNISENWRQVTGTEASGWALQGRRAHACLPSWVLKEQHGHIARIYPAPMAVSGSLGHAVPMCANIGIGDPSKDLQPLPNGTQTKDNWVCKISQAFPVHIGEPFYFLWLG